MCPRAPDGRRDESLEKRLAVKAMLRRATRSSELGPRGQGNGEPAADVDCELLFAPFNPLAQLVDAADTERLINFLKLVALSRLDRECPS